MMKMEIEMVLMRLHSIGGGIGAIKDLEIEIEAIEETSAWPGKMLCNNKGNWKEEERDDGNLPLI